MIKGRLFPFIPERLIAANAAVLTSPPKPETADRGALKGLALLAVAPFIGLAYLILMPLIGFAVFFVVLGMGLAKKLRGQGAEDIG